MTPGPDDVETRPGPGRDRPLRDDAVSLALRAPHRLLTPLRAARRRADDTSSKPQAS